MKKVLALALATVMVLALCSTALATASVYAGTYDPDPGATNTTWTGTGSPSITVALPQDASGNYPAGSNTFKIYKVFDAVKSDAGITYTSRQGATLPNISSGDAFFADDAGNIHYGTYAAWNDGTDTGAYFYVGGAKVKVTEGTTLSAAAITAVKDYVRAADLVATVVTAAGDSSFTVGGLDYGYYFIDTTIGSVVAIDSTNPDASITNKWDIPNIDKTVKEDSLDEYQKQNDAEIGQDVEFKIVIHAKPGATRYVLHDKMTAGLTFNKDVAVTIGSTSVATFSDYDTDATTGIILASGRTYKSNATDTGTTGTFTLTFPDAWLNSNITANTDITVTYTATVNDNAVVNTPDVNDTVLTYGNDNYTNEDHTKTYVWGIDVTKQDGSDSTKLAGAKFVIYKAGTTANTIQTAKFDSNGKLTGWSTEMSDSGLKTKTESDFDSVSILTTAASTGKIVVTGLDEGTYTLLEVEAPAGYNKMTDTVDVTIDSTSDTADGKSLTNALDAATSGYKTVTVDNYAGTELPSTGGIGTTIFYVSGLLMVLGASIILIARRRADAE